mmetsp:Transcript_37382/g.80995  ORF Transcript_37382/g.80995 Transcript_37382/m.80995 type:complete len:90 (-) Transcript_37382:24-293(-)
MTSRCYGAPADVYSFAIMLWELYHAPELPFQGTEPMQLMLQVVQQHRRPPINPDTCPPAIGDLTARSWSPQPADRPSMPQIIRELEALQ